MQKLEAEMQPLASATSLPLFGRRAREAEGTGLGLTKGEPREDRIGGGEKNKKECKTKYGEREPVDTLVS